MSDTNDRITQALAQNLAPAAALVPGEPAAAPLAPEAATPKLKPLADHEREMLHDLLERASVGVHELGGTREESAGEYCPVFSTETEVYPGENCTEAGPLAVFARRVDAALFAVSQAYFARLLADNQTLAAQVTRQRDELAEQEVALLNEHLSGAGEFSRAQKAEAALADIREYLQDHSDRRPHVLEVDIPALIDSVIGPLVPDYSRGSSMENSDLDQLPF